MKFGRKTEEPVEQPAEEKPKNTSVGINLGGNPEPEKPEKKHVFTKEKEIIDEDRIGTWADTGYKMSDKEAHRDVSYDGSSSVKRTMWVFVNQMKLFSKNKFTFLLVFAALLIPVIILGVSTIDDALVKGSAGSTAYIGNVLEFMPVMVCLFTAILCGTQVANEFKDRTAYMSIPLPMTRLEFYLGKYLAGFVLCLGVFLMAFGFSVLLAMRHYDTFFSDQISMALICTIITIFVFSATSYCVGCFMKRGSALVPLVLMLVVLPMIACIIYAEYEIVEVFMLPCFLPDSIVFTLGATPFSLAGMFSALLDSAAITDNLMGLIGTGIIWGVAFLILGALKITRREM